MFQVRIHGRGGQGVVTAAELLSVAAFDEGRFAQAFPSFGSERTGAPVVSFCRISEVPIRTREPITEPDALMVLDPTLLRQVDLFAGLRHDGYVLLNWPGPLADLGLSDALSLLRPARIRCVPATELALAHTGRPVPNAVLLGAFAALTGVVSLKSVIATIDERFEESLARSNSAAATAAYQLVAQQREELDAAPA